MIRMAILLAFAMMLTSIPHKAFAQTDPEEAYDPFSDYSEFDEASDEEADINFFRNGRFLTVGLALGPQSFTDGMAKAYGDGPAMGVYLSYFFDLRIAMSLGLMAGDHNVKIKTTGGSVCPSGSCTGTVSFNEVNFHLKYYFNTQNVKRGLADLNPYAIGGFSQVTRTYSIAELLTQSKATATSTDLGLGIEIPLLRRKAYLGVQFLYHFISFTDENKATVNGTDPLAYKINGDFINSQLILGMNF
jgi:hypothetical protein